MWLTEKIMHLSILSMRFASIKPKKAGAGKKFLSILSMRFDSQMNTLIDDGLSAFNSLYEIPLEGRQVKIVIQNDFQFSLWDSERRNWWLFETATHDLSILSMRFSLNARASGIWFITTFNSLYEILDIMLADNYGNARCVFQFSLWDSWGGALDTMAGPTFHPFNSLYEIPTSG